MSGTKAEESSGLLHTFPPGGNDHAWVIPVSVGGAIRLTPRPAFLGRLFQTRLYHSSVFGEFSRTAELAERPASMQACLPVEVDSGLRRNDDSG